MKFEYLGDKEDMNAFGYDFSNGQTPDVTNPVAVKRLSGNKFFRAIEEEPKESDPDPGAEDTELDQDTEVEQETEETTAVAEEHVNEAIPADEAVTMTEQVDQQRGIAEPVKDVPANEVIPANETVTITEQVQEDLGQDTETATPVEETVTEPTTETVEDVAQDTVETPVEEQASLLLDQPPEEKKPEVSAGKGSKKK